MGVLSCFSEGNSFNTESVSSHNCTQATYPLATVLEFLKKYFRSFFLVSSDQL